MMGLPNWLRGKEDDLDMTHDEPIVKKWKEHVSGNPIPLPPTAMIEKKPLPFHIAPRDDDQAAAVVAQAHTYIEQWKIERIEQQKKVEQLESDLKAEQRKSGLLELDIAQHVNNIAVLQSQIITLQEREEKYRTFLSVKKQINEKERLTYEQFQIDDPPKREKKPNAKTIKVVKKEITNRKETDRPVEKDPTI